MTDRATIISEIMDNIRRVFRMVNDKSRQAERETGITGPQLWAIKIIGDLSPVSVSDLAARRYLLVSILGAQEIPPQLTLSPEVNVPRRERKQRTIKIIEGQNAIFSSYTVLRRRETAGKERNADKGPPIF